MRKSDFEVKRITAPECKPLRHQVLWPHIERLEDCNIDIDLREDAMHYSTVVDGKIVSIASFFAMPTDKLDFEKQYRLRAMATDPNFRKMGMGRVLIEQALQDLKDTGVDVLWCNARKMALGFYESLDFDVIDEWFEVPHVGMHKLMYKVL